MFVFVRTSKPKQHFHKRSAKTLRIGSLISETITPICQQNGFIQARILLEWDYIVTPQFAQWCIPLKVTFPFNQRNNGYLLVKATSSMATEIAYQEPQILNRINQYFGYQAINKIKVFQGPISKKSAPLQQPPLPPLDKAQSDFLEEQVNTVHDEKLRSALLSLGGGISQKSKFLS